LMVLQQIQLWCSHQIHSRSSAFSGGLPCTEEEKHSNAEQWYTVVKKEKLHHKKLVKRVGIPPEVKLQTPYTDCTTQCKHNLM
jgi:hypothetical protein